MPSASNRAVCTSPVDARKVMTMFLTGILQIRSRSALPQSVKKCRFNALVAMIASKLSVVSGPMSVTVSLFAAMSCGLARARLTFARAGVCAAGQSSANNKFIGSSSVPRSSGGSDDITAAVTRVALGSGMAAPRRRMSALRSMAKFLVLRQCGVSRKPTADEESASRCSGSGASSSRRRRADAVLQPI